LQRFEKLAGSDLAKWYGLEVVKDTIAVGYDADMVI
jgi:hypothetical protein